MRFLGHLSVVVCGLFGRIAVYLVLCLGVRLWFV